MISSLGFLYHFRNEFEKKFQLGKIDLANIFQRKGAPKKSIRAGGGRVTACCLKVALAAICGGSRACAATWTGGYKWCVGGEPIQNGCCVRTVKQADEHASESLSCSWRSNKGMPRSITSRSALRCWWSATRSFLTRSKRGSEIGAGRQGARDEIYMRGRSRWLT